MDLVQPRSVLDVGCGLGTWLKAFEECGVKDFKGVDGAYVNKTLLRIPQERFYAHDLTQAMDLGRKFDLVMTLEVAEHLEKELADQFVKTLVGHGDLILFSAAVPGQGGQHHVNEAWLSQWVKIFSKHDFILYDVLRPKIWNNNAIEVWYKQNIVMFCKRGHHLEERLKKESTPYIDIVHPDLFAFYREQAERAAHYEQGKLGIQLAWKSLISAVKEKFR
ncbi:MAG: class I SAM-dependent methyltransferase [Bacteroidota bacterium]